VDEHEPASGARREGEESQKGRMPKTPKARKPDSGLTLVPFAIQELRELTEATSVLLAELHSCKDGCGFERILEAHEQLHRKFLAWAIAACK
jgi:hypothetical protein